MLRHDPERFNRVVERVEAGFPTVARELEALGAGWRIGLKLDPLADHPSAWDVTLDIECVAGGAQAVSVLLEFEIPQWSSERHVLLPGAAYNGNRFISRRIPYSPKLHFGADIGPDVGMIVSDVPRLEIGDGPSVLHDRSGSMATPAVAVHDPLGKRGLWLLARQGNAHGDYGFRIEEGRGRKKAWIGLQSPVVREGVIYQICNLGTPSDDVPADFATGDTLRIECRLVADGCEDVQGLHDGLCRWRKALHPPALRPRALSLGCCFEIQQEKFNRMNFVPEHGYYSVGLRENYMQDWQIGWTGGMISTLPLLLLGREETRANVLRNFDWLFPAGISPAGLFWDSCRNGTEWIGGDLRKAHTHHWHLIRKSGDAVFYIVRQFRIMEALGIAVKDAWRDGTRRVANTLADLWEREGQFGQFVDALDGRVIVGGSSSGAIIPAALVHAAACFGDDRLLRVAIESAHHFHQHFTSRGIACGGPGDALQNPDSESAYALVESYVAVWEATGDDKWLVRAGEAARQLASWVVAYDYGFPADSMFGRAGIRSTGAVYANTQNKHAAPGLCTSSGLALFKLFRAAGDVFAAELLGDIARGLPQYLSTPRLPLGDSPAGFMCERVNLTDWEGKERIGETWGMSTWAETSLMLTAAEIPGIYVRPDDGTLLVFDQIDAEIADATDAGIRLRLHNPTPEEARVRIMRENRRNALSPLPDSALLAWPVEILAPGETRMLEFPTADS